MKSSTIKITIIIVVVIIVGLAVFLFLNSYFKNGRIQLPEGDLSDCPYPEEICVKWYPDAVPNCQEDSFNCGDFETQEGAQWVYDYCIDAGDVHRLDSDGDGVVCESLA